jgi:hypothetical protein
MPSAPGTIAPVLHRHRHVLLFLVAAGAVTLACWLAVGTSRGAPATPLGYAPADTVAVLHARLDRLRQSELVQQLWPELTQSASLERLCGFDPLSQVREALVLLPPGDAEGLGSLGLVAKGTFDRDALPTCVERIVGGEGTRVQTATIDGVPALASAAGGSRAVFVSADTVAVGNERLARGVLRSAGGQEPSAETDPVMSELWGRAGSDRDVTLVARLPSRLRKLVPPLARRYLRAQVDEVIALAMGVDVSRGLELGLVAQMADAEQADRSVRALQASLERARSEPVVAFSVIGKVLRRVSLAAEGPEVVATVSLPDDDVRAVVELLEQVRMSRGRAPRAAPPTPGIEPAEERTPSDAP